MLNHEEREAEKLREEFAKILAEIERRQKARRRALVECTFWWFAVAIPESLWLILFVENPWLHAAYAMQCLVLGWWVGGRVARM